MSEAVARAERELYAYITALQDVLRMTTEDAIPESLWEGDPAAGVAAYHGSEEDEKEDEVHLSELPDTLLQRVERETAQEKHRINELLHRRVTPQQNALCAALVQLGGGQDAAGNVVDVPVDTLDREIAAVAAESAELGRRIVELYDEAAAMASQIETEIMRPSVPSL